MGSIITCAGTIGIVCPGLPAILVKRSVNSFVSHLATRGCGSRCSGFVFYNASNPGPTTPVNGVLVEVLGTFGNRGCVSDFVCGVTFNDCGGNFSKPSTCR